MAMVSFFLKEGAQVMISDSREISELKEMVSSFDRADPPLLLEGEGHSPEFFLKSDMVAVSPGIPLDLPALKAVREKGTPVFGEVEIFADRSLTPVVAVTGTNGKTTTTALLNEMLVNSGKKTFLGGNIGRPLMDFILGGQGQEIGRKSAASTDATHFSPRVGSFEYHRRSFRYSFRLRGQAFRTREGGL
jgi:UDP-N-acetylmuramoylalanine--D-glutamate ligase